MGERRKFPRLYKNFKVELKRLIFPLKEQKVIETKCINISAGGLLLRVEDPFEIKDKVQVFLYILNIGKFHGSFFKVFEPVTDQKVSAIGEVVRVEKIGDGVFEIGIRFVDIYDEDWKALYNFILDEIKRNNSN